MDDTQGSVFPALVEPRQQTPENTQQRLQLRRGYGLSFFHMGRWDLHSVGNVAQDQATGPVSVAPGAKSPPRRYRRLAAPRAGRGTDPPTVLLGRDPRFVVSGLSFF